MDGLVKRGAQQHVAMRGQASDQTPMAHSVSARHSRHPLSAQTINFDVSVIKRYGQKSFRRIVGIYGREWAYAIGAAIQIDCADRTAHDAQVPQLHRLVVTRRGYFVVANEYGRVHGAIVGFIHVHGEDFVAKVPDLKREKVLVKVGVFFFDLGNL